MSAFLKKQHSKGSPRTCIGDWGRRLPVVVSEVQTMSGATDVYGGVGSLENISIGSSTVLHGNASAESVAISTWSGNSLSLMTTLTSAYAVTNGLYGVSVANLNTTYIVGAPGEADVVPYGKGLVFIYDTSYSLAQILSSPNAVANGSFGNSVSISGSFIGVGAFDEGPAVGTYWSTTANLNTGRRNLAGAGTNTAALAFGGQESAASFYSTVTESFNGTTWSAIGGASLTGRRYLAGAGTSSATLAFGGWEQYATYSTVTESFNGTTWSSIGAASLTGRFSLVGAGTNTAALAFGGQGQYAAYSTVTESFDGTTWSSTANLNVGRRGLAGAGTNTAALAFGGQEQYTAYSTVTESFNVTTWSSIGAASLTGRFSLAGAGTNTAALAFGGQEQYVTYSTVTESFDGTTWSSTANLNVGRSGLAGAGTNTAALAFGGWESTTSYSTVTERFDVDVQRLTHNAGTWSATANLNTGRRYLAGAGTNTAALAFGGWESTTSYSTVTERFDGTTWSAIGGASLTGRRNLAGAGTNTAALAFGGREQYTAYSTVTERFDGTTWSSIGATSLTGRYSLAGAGINTAALAFGGWESTTSYSTVTERFNGTTWSAVGATSLTGRFNLAGAGTSAAALAFGGQEQYAAYSTVTESFDGTTWSSTGAASLTGRRNLAGAGTNTAALAFGGWESSTNYSTVTERFNAFPNNGMTHVYRYIGSSASLVASLTPPNPVEIGFGKVVIMSGNVLVVGNNALNGSVYVYLWNTTTSQFDLKSTLTSSSGATVTGFGSSIAFDGTTLLVGSPLDTANTLLEAGRVFVYNWGGVTMSYRTVIQEVTPAVSNNFGYSVDILNTKAVISSPHSTLDHPTYIGRVYEYEYDLANTFTLTTIRKPNSPSTPAGDFGRYIKLGANNFLGVSASGGYITSNKLLDYSNNTNIATLKNTATIDTTGIVLDGIDACVDAGDIISFDGLSTFSIYAEFSASATSTPEQVIIAKYSANGSKYTFKLSLVSTTKKVSLTVYGDVLATNFSTWTTSTNVVTLGEPIKVIVTCNLTSFSVNFYINKVLTANTAVVTGTGALNTLLDSASSLTIGSDSSFTHSFNGKINEVLFFSSVLKSYEREELFKIPFRDSSLRSFTTYSSLKSGSIPIHGPWRDITGARNLTLAGNAIVTSPLGLILDGSTTTYAIDNTISPAMISPLTITGWVKIPDNAVFNQTIIATAFVDIGNFRIFKKASSNLLSFMTFADTAGAISEIVDGVIIPNNTWHFFTVVINGLSITLYQDSVQTATATFVNPFSANLAPIILGVSRGASHTPQNYDALSGTLDGMQIYSYILSPVQITDLFNTTLR